MRKPQATMVNGGLYLVISNVAVVPAFIEALVLAQFPEAALLGSSGIISMFYHLCQKGYFCIKGSPTNYSVLQNTDQLIDFVLILWFVGYIIRLTETYGRLQLLMSAVFIGLAIVLVPLYGSASFFVYEIVFLAAAAAIFVIVMMLINYIFKAPGDPERWKWDVNPNRKWIAVLDFAIALAFVVAAIILFYLAGDPGDNNYDIYHATWHILIYLSVVFILDIPYGNIVCVKNLAWFYYVITNRTKEFKREPYETNWDALGSEISAPSRLWATPGEALIATIRKYNIDFGKLLLDEEIKRALKKRPPPALFAPAPAYTPESKQEFVPEVQHLEIYQEGAPDIEVYNTQHVNRFYRPISFARQALYQPLYGTRRAHGYGKIK